MLMDQEPVSVFSPWATYDLGTSLINKQVRTLFACEINYLMIMNLYKPLYISNTEMSKKILAKGVQLKYFIYVKRS